MIGFGTHAWATSEARLGPNSARLEFQFSAPSFAAPETTRFRYRRTVDLENALKAADIARDSGKRTGPCRA
jgi:hypothetical protein